MTINSQTRHSQEHSLKTQNMPTRGLDKASWPSCLGALKKHEGCSCMLSRSPTRLYCLQNATTRSQLLITFSRIHRDPWRLALYCSPCSRCANFMPNNLPISSQHI